jgi:hypothetical protein
VPDLRPAAQGPPPFWRRVVTALNTALDRLPGDQPVVLVAHSNTGVFMPVLAARAHRFVAGCLFVDATLPARHGSTPAMPPQATAVLRTRASQGLLPAWTDWFDETDIAPLFPDPQTRAEVSAEQPRLPVSYCEEHAPVPEGWDRRPCGYLLFSPLYHDSCEQARERGWLVRQLPGGHLHQLVAPSAVADHLLRMAAELDLAGG